MFLFQINLFLIRLHPELDATDIDVLAKVMTALSFQKNDPIITEGEKSSFFAIILEGTLAVTIGNKEIPLQAGSLLGEISYFEGGTRTANVIVKSTSAVVAFILFAELDQLKMSAPMLRLKMINMFAVQVRKERLV